MSIEAVAFGKSIAVLSLTMQYAQYDIPSMEVTVPLRDIAGQDIYFEDIAFYRDGQLLDSGFIRTPQLVPDLSDSNATVRLRCENELGRLTCELPVNLRLDQAIPWTAIHYLLSTTQQSTWVFGDNRVYPFLQPELPGILTGHETSLDLSGAQNLWEQLVTLGQHTQHSDQASGTPLFFRAGAARGENGFYQLDMGYFGEYPDTNRIIHGVNTLGPATINEPTREPIKQIVPRAGHPDVVLSDALNLVPTLAAHPSYPLDVGSESVVNNTINLGCILKKQYDAIKPPSDTPSATELNQAALALYYAARRDLMDSQPYLTLTQRCFLEKPPRLHEMIWVDTFVNEYTYDLYTGRFQIVDTYRLQQWLRIVGIKMDYRERYESVDRYTGQRVPAEIYELELTSSDQRDVYDPNLVLYNELKTPEENEVGLVISTHHNMTFGADVSVTYSGRIADADFNGLSTGKNIYLPNPLSPLGTYVLPLLGVTGSLGTSDQLTGASNRVAAYRLKVTQPASLTQSLNLVASGHAGEAWDTDDDLPLGCRYVYYDVS